MMRNIKKAIALAVALISVFSCFCVFANAETGANVLFIDGVNIMRSSDSAILYRDVASTGQDRWGHDVVLDKNGTVTKIITANSASGNDLAVPQEGAVISSTGKKADWFKKYVSVGTKLYFDEYTKKLFLCDKNGNFDPYFEKSIKVVGSGSEFTVSSTGEGSNSTYSYKVSVDKNGVIDARGSDAALSEGGFIVSAVSDEDREFLIMYALVGGKCVIKDGTAVFSYTKDMLKTTVEKTLAAVKAQADAVIKEHISYWDSLDYCIRHVEEILDNPITYKTATEAAETLRNTMRHCYAGIEAGSELRGAFHVPTETDDAAVEKTVTAVKEANLNTIILKISNGYNSIIPLPEGSKFQQNEVFKGFDVLDSFIKVCEKEGVTLSICIDVYYNENASVAEPNWLSKTNSAKVGLANKYFSPASAEFKTYFLDYVKYIVTSYDVKHVMFDYLRYPKFYEDCDLGYDTKTLEAFSNKYKVPMNEVEAIKTELFQSKHWQNWVKFKMSLVSDMAKAISETVKNNAPNVTTTVISARDSVDYYYMQDAYSWVQKEYFDGLCLALYEGDADENDSFDKNAYYDKVVTTKGKIAGAYTGKDAFFFVGLESSADLDVQLLANAIGESRRINSDGFILDSLSGYFDRNYGWFDGVTADIAKSPLGDIEEIITAVIGHSETRMALFCTKEEFSTIKSQLDDFLKDLKTNAHSISKIKKIRDDVAIILSKSDAKESILTDYEKLVKIAKITGITEPVIPDESSDAPSEDESVESSEESLQEESVSTVSDSDDSSKISFSFNIDTGAVLVYGFVGLTLIAAIVSFVIGIKRKKAQPKRNHMPKTERNVKNDEDNE